MARRKGSQSPASGKAPKALASKPRVVKVKILPKATPRKRDQLRFN